MLYRVAGKSGIEGYILITRSYPNALLPLIPNRPLVALLFVHSHLSGIRDLPGDHRQRHYLMSNEENDDRLWGPEELAAFMKLSKATIISLSNKTPTRLPPRVSTMPSLRWMPSLVKQWAREATYLPKPRPAARGTHTKE